MRHSFAAFAMLALGLARDPGCGGVDDPDGGPNAPCTRSSDCGSGLVCLEGVCREPDAGRASSGGDDSGADSGASQAPPEAGADGG